MPTRDGPDSSRAPSALWRATVGPFAEALGKTVEELTLALAPLVGAPDDEAARSLQDEALTPFEDVSRCLPGVPTARLRRALQALRRGGGPRVSERAPSVDGEARAADVLPPLPDDEAFTQALVTGGVAKVAPTDVVAAVRAALALRAGLYEVPARLHRAMEEHAEALESPAPEAFYLVDRLLVQRGHAEVLRALGVSERFASNAHMQHLARRMASVWTALRDFHARLVAWHDAWVASSGNPAVLLQALAAMANGGSGPVGVVPPDTAPVRDAARAVVDALNRALAGTAIPVARAQAAEAQSLRTLLDLPDLPGTVGAVSREDLLRKLGVKATAEQARMESSVARYALGVMALPELPARGELGYTQALLSLGNTVPWGQLCEGAAGAAATGHRKF